MDRFSVLLEDPLRYVLTTSDGAVEDYGKLPSNVHMPGDCTYENPFLTADNQTSSSATLQSTGEGFDYQNGGVQPSFDSVSGCIMSLCA